MLTMDGMGEVHNGCQNVFSYKGGFYGLYIMRSLIMIQVGNEPTKYRSLNYVVGVVMQSNVVVQMRKNTQLDAVSL
jgi:hypothetical protein